MAFVDPTDMSLYPYLAAGGALVALLAMAAHFGGGAKLRVPTVVVATVAGLGTGLALGVILMGLLGFRLQEPSPPEAGSPDDPRQRVAAGGPMPGTGMPPGMGGPPSARLQQATLVGKIDLLTGKPLALKLSDEQRRKVREQLAGLDKLDALGEEDAQKRLGALLAALEDDKETLDAVNYRGPGPGGPPGRGAPAPLPANPFREGAARGHVQSLQRRLEPPTGDSKGP